jgi:hypothetical protein
MLVARRSLALLLGLAGLTAGTARADNPPIATPYLPVFHDTSTLGPVVSTDDFTNLSLTNHPTYPTLANNSQAWPAPIASDVASSRQTFFQKTPGFEQDYTDFTDAGGGGGIYSFFSNTHFEITSGLAAAGITAFELQISTSEGSDDVDITVPPTLTLFTTSGQVSLAPTSSSLLSQTPVTIASFGNAQVNIDLEGYEWDVSAYTGTITGATFDWQVDTHSITYGAELAQAVPEPSSALLLLFCGAPILFRRARGRPRNT